MRIEKQNKQTNKQKQQLQQQQKYKANDISKLI